MEMRYDDERLGHETTLQDRQKAEKKFKETSKLLNEIKLDHEQVRISCFSELIQLFQIFCNCFKTIWFKSI